ncbi:MAG: DUF952 domain-containing protein [Flavisolibacter sp.]|nr:DUF952 domain-containing protein [Flavisolibacter sp.]
MYNLNNFDILINISNKGSVSKMNLYRIISDNEWTQSEKDGKVPRCNSDTRAGHIHLNKFDDIKTVANKYFETAENPVVLEVEISSELYKKLIWEPSTKEKNWEQAHLLIENIDMNDVKRYSYLIINDKIDGQFEVGEFSSLTD